VPDLDPSTRIRLAALGQAAYDQAMVNPRIPNLWSHVVDTILDAHADLPVLATPADLDALSLGSAVQMYDGLIYQALSMIDGKAAWMNTQDGHDYPSSSAELLESNDGAPPTLLYRGGWEL
jgi:hypothetical protein